MQSITLPVFVENRPGAGGNIGIAVIYCWGKGIICPYVLQGIVAGADDISGSWESCREVGEFVSYETHRGMARSFAVVTASTAGTAHAPEAVDLGRVATAVDTLVLLMAAGKLEETCRALIAAGRPSDEPSAIIQWATTPEERGVIATLEELPVLAAAAGIGPPATLVVGAVASIPATTAALASQLPAVTRAT